MKQPQNVANKIYRDLKELNIATKKNAKRKTSK